MRRLLGPAPSGATDAVTKGFVDTADAATLASAKSYADSQDDIDLAAAKSYADSRTPAASTTVSGISRLATTAEGTAGSLATVSATPASVKAYADAGDSSTLASAKTYADQYAPTLASTTSSGIIRVATQAETNSGSGTTIAVSPATMKAYTDQYALPTRLGSLGQDVSSTDLNSLVTTGFYRGSSLTNSPTGNGWYYVLVQAHDTGSWQMQTATGYTDVGANRQFIRQRRNGTWDAWTELTNLSTVTSGDASTLASAKSYADAGDALQVTAAAAGNGTVYAKNGSGTVIGIGYGTSGTASNAIPQRQSNGQIAVPATPAATTDAASKSYVDAGDALQVTAAAAAANQAHVKDSSGVETGLGYDKAASNNTLAQRSATGTLEVATPTATTHAATKAYVDAGDALQVTSAAAGASQVHAKNSSGVETGIAYSTSANANQLVQRDGSAQVAVPQAPTATNHATSKSYVDTLAATKEGVFQSTTIDNGDLMSTMEADTNSVRSWLETAADMGPTLYALSRVAPGIANEFGYEVVRPGGGVNDEVAINAALARSSMVVITGEFRTSGTILIPSHTNLVLMNAYVQLQPQSNCNIISNSNKAVNGNTDIRLLGVGRAVVDGMSDQQTKVSGATWNNVGIHWVGVSKYQVRGITIKNTSDFSALNVGCTQGVWTDITLDQDRKIGNQDGIDIGPGCSYIYITNVRGVIEDDFCSIFAKYTTGGGSVHPSFATYGGDVHHIYISDVFVNTTKSLVRMQAAEGRSLHNVYIDNVHHTGDNMCQSFLNLGELKSAYISGESPNLNGTDFFAIYASNMSGRTDAMVRAGTSARDLFFSNFSSDQWNYVVLGSEADRTCQIQNMNIDGVFTQDKNGLNTTGVVLQIQNSYVTLVDCSITRMNIQTCDRVTNSSSATSGRLSGVFGKVNLRVLGGSTAFAGETDITVKTTPPATGATAPTKPGYTYIRNNS